MLGTVVAYVGVAVAEAVFVVVVRDGEALALLWGLLSSGGRRANRQAKV